MRKKLELMLLLLVITASGCGAQIEDTNEAALAVATLPVETSELSGEDLDEDTKDRTVDNKEGKEEQQTNAEDAPLTGIDEEAWELYAAAQAKMEALTAREEHSMVYTTQEDETGRVEQSIQVRVKFTGLGSEQAQLSAAGTVKVNDEVIPLEIYYRDGYVYTSGASGRVKGQSTFEETAATVDILGGLSKELIRDYITAIRQISYADGSVIIELAFKGDINGMDTMGTGEVILNEEGYVISQKFDLQAEVTVEGIPAMVRQSAECILINYGSDVTDVEFPDLSTYLDATILQEAN